MAILLMDTRLERSIDVCAATVVRNDFRAVHVATAGN